MLLIAMLPCSAPSPATAEEAAPGDAPGETSITLDVGQSREIRLPESAEIRVTRRGVVDVHQGGGGDRWLLTGLRGGFVLVEGVDSETGEPLPGRYHVTVAAKARNDGADSRDLSGLPGWLCRRSAVRCDMITGVVSGQVADWQWYARAFDVCQAEPACFFRVRLTPAGEAAARQTIEAQLGSEYAARHLPDGRWAVAGPCDDEGRPRRLTETTARLGSAGRSGLASIGCHTERQRLAYKLTARLYLAESGTARRLGFMPNAALRLGGAAPPAGTLSSSLVALENEHGVEAVGSPETLLLPDRPVEIQSGGEFQVVEPDRDGDGLRAAWKQHGLTLSVRATPLTGRRARLRIDGALRFRAGGAHALTLSSLATQLDLTLGQPTLAATLDLATSARETELLPFLGRLPVVGPLFRLSGRGQASTRLIVWLELDEVERAVP